MNTILGANWRTTLFGWIAILASAIAINPSLVAFLPETIRNYVTGFAGILAVVSGGTFATQAKDKNVTGGSVPNDAGNTNITPLILLALLPVFSLSGCAWVSTHQAQVDATLSVVGQRALTVAEQTLISAATNGADKNKKADFLDAVASGLRQNESNIVTANDVAQIVKIWSPNDGAQWQELAGNLASLTGNALNTAGNTQASTIVENIATGLNNAAAQARGTATAQ